MALNFPNSPTNGQLYTDSASGNRWVWDSGNTCWVSTSTFTQTITVASSAPGSPVTGQLWWNKDYGRLLVYYTDDNTSQWVDASPSDYTSQLAYNQANTVFNQSNTVYGVSNAAFAKANNALANTSGVSFNGDFNVPSGNVAIGTTSSSYPIGLGSYANGVKIALRGATNEYAIGTESNELKIASYSATTFYTGGYGGTQLMRLDNSGRLTTPYQPLFYGSRNGTGGWTSGYNSTAVFNYNTTYLNIGSSYNTSTGTFTCPIAGYYRVHASILVGNNNSSMGIFLYKNGAQYGEQGYHASNGPVVLLPMTWVVSCAANDTLKIYAQCASGPGVFDNAYNYLNIELVG